MVFVNVPYDSEFQQFVIKHHFQIEDFSNDFVLDYIFVLVFSALLHILEFNVHMIKISYYFSFEFFLNK